MPFEVENAKNLLDTFFKLKWCIEFRTSKLDNWVKEAKMSQPLPIRFQEHLQVSIKFPRSTSKIAFISLDEEKKRENTLKLMSFSSNEEKIFCCCEHRSSFAFFFLLFFGSTIIILINDDDSDGDWTYKLLSLSLCSPSKMRDQL